MNSGKERMIGVGIVAVGLIILLGKLGTFSFLGRNFWYFAVFNTWNRTACNVHEA